MTDVPNILDISCHSTHRVDRRPISAGVLLRALGGRVCVLAMVLFYHGLN